MHEGPLWYRARIRRFGPLLALATPAVLWMLDAAVRGVLDGRARGWTSLLLRLCAAPGLLAVGYPFATRTERPLGIALSVPLWLLIGYAAARVATRNPVARFSDYWRAYRWLAGAVIVGVGAAYVVAAATVGLDTIRAVLP